MQQNLAKDLEYLYRFARTVNVRSQVRECISNKNDCECGFKKEDQHELQRGNRLAPVLGDEVLEPLLGIPGEVVDLVVDGGRVALLEADKVVAVVVVDLCHRLHPRVPPDTAHFAFKRNQIQLGFNSFLVFYLRRFSAEQV